MPKTSKDEQIDRLKRLKPFILAATKGKMLPDRMFANCLRASLSKSYELCLDAYATRRSRVAFFLVPSLRSICEDLIVLSFVARMPKGRRNGLVALLMRHELADRLQSQSTFFALARPDQPVLGPGWFDTKKIEDEIREIWKQHGWPGLATSWMPPVRQIAEKNHIDVLTTLYDYIYRLTSGMVHFNPAVLFRSGWGPIPDCHFSPKNFDRYYLACVRIYGMFLFLCYFELFGRHLRPGRKVSQIIVAMREKLVGEQRWPEMITYEEMNLEPPKGAEVLRILYRVVDADRRKNRLLDRR